MFYSSTCLASSFSLLTTLEPESGISRLFGYTETPHMLLTIGALIITYTIVGFLIILMVYPKTLNPQLNSSIPPNPILSIQAATLWFRALFWI